MGLFFIAQYIYRRFRRYLQQHRRLQHSNNNLQMDTLQPETVGEQSPLVTRQEQQQQQQQEQEQEHIV